MSSISTSPLYRHNKAPCTGITRGLYGGYKMLIVRLQKVCSRTTNSFEQTPLRQNAVYGQKQQTTFSLPILCLEQLAKTLLPC